MLRDSGILWTDFVCAYPSVNHEWIFRVQRRAGIPVLVHDFLWRTCESSITTIEYAGTTRGHFPMARGVRQGMPRERIPLQCGIWSIFRWLHDAVVPRDPSLSLFTARTLCVCR